MLVYQRVFDLPRVKSVGSRMSTGVQRINAVWTAGVVEIEASKHQDIHNWLVVSNIFIFHNIWDNPSH